MRSPVLQFLAHQIRKSHAAWAEKDLSRCCITTTKRFSPSIGCDKDHQIAADLCLLLATRLFQVVQVHERHVIPDKHQQVEISQHAYTGGGCQSTRSGSDMLEH